MSDVNIAQPKISQAELDSQILRKAAEAIVSQKAPEEPEFKRPELTEDEKSKRGLKFVGDKVWAFTLPQDPYTSELFEPCLNVMGIEGHDIGYRKFAIEAVETAATLVGSDKPSEVVAFLKDKMNELPNVENKAILLTRLLRYDYRDLVKKIGKEAN